MGIDPRQKVIVQAGTGGERIADVSSLRSAETTYDHPDGGRHDALP